MVKNTPANAGDSELRLRSLVWEDLLKDRDSMVAQMVKASACNVGDPSSILGLGRSPGEGNGNPLQYSCLDNPMEGESHGGRIPWRENPMEGGAW